jgi:phospholipase C
MSLLVEEGYKPVRGKLTEGRYLTFETLGLALSNVQGQFVSVSLATDRHERLDQRWIVHSVGGPNYGNKFYIQSALDGQYIARLPRIGSLTNDEDYAQAFSITYDADTVSYSISPIQVQDKYVSFKPQLAKNVRRDKQIVWTGNGFGEFKLYAVSYH